MYGLVPYNLSDIQKAIQFGHAVVEHMLWSETDESYAARLGGRKNVVLRQFLSKFRLA